MLQRLALLPAAVVLSVAILITGVAVTTTPSPLHASHCQSDPEAYCGCDDAAPGPGWECNPNGPCTVTAVICSRSCACTI